MSRKQDALCMLKLIGHILYQRRVNKFFMGILCFCIGCYALFAFVFLLTALDTFAWLMYGSMGMGIIVGAVGIMWRIRDVVKQIKRDNRGESSM